MGRPPSLASLQEGYLLGLSSLGQLAIYDTRDRSLLGLWRPEAQIRLMDLLPVMPAPGAAPGPAPLLCLVAAQDQASSGLRVAILRSLPPSGGWGEVFVGPELLEGPVAEVTISGTDRAAARLGNNRLLLWNPWTGEPLLEQQPGPVRCLAAGPGVLAAVVGGAKEGVLLWTSMPQELDHFNGT